MGAVIQGVGIALELDLVVATLDLVARKAVVVGVVAVVACQVARREAEHHVL